MSQSYPVVILAFEGSMEMSIVMARDLFYAGSTAKAHSQTKPTQAAHSQTNTSVVVASQDGQAVTTFSGSRCSVDAAISDITAEQLVIVSGIWGDLTDMLSEADAILEWITQQYQSGATIACLHTGSFLLAETGLLNDRTATVYWPLVEQFKQRYPKVKLQPEKNITASERLYCAAGLTSSIEMGIFLIEQLWGSHSANKVARHFMMDMPRLEPDYVLALEQQHNHQDPQIHQAQRWLETHYANEFLLDEVASNVGLSLRSFRRRFNHATQESPLQYLHRIRLATAKHLLRNSGLSVEQIAFRVGYQDSNYFTRLFKQKNTLTPSQFRAQKKT